MGDTPAVIDDAASQPADRGYRNDVSDLRQRVLLMAGRVEQMISDSVRSLVERDTELARATIRQDHRVNRAEMEADELCIQILARRRLEPEDLRFVTLALKMVTDLERIADLAVNISERALDLAIEPQLRSYVDISKMARTTQSMVRDAIDAFVSEDASKAEAVVVRDDIVDNLFRHVVRAVLELMLQDSAAVERGIHVQSAAKFLERMADHATNLAEQVVFMVKGKDIRHEGKL